MVTIVFDHVLETKVTEFVSFFPQVPVFTDLWCHDNIINPAGQWRVLSNVLSWQPLAKTLDHRGEGVRFQLCRCFTEGGDPAVLPPWLVVLHQRGPDFVFLLLRMNGDCFVCKLLVLASSFFCSPSFKIWRPRFKCSLLCVHHSHSRRITCELSESAQEQRIVLYKSNQQHTDSLPACISGLSLPDPLCSSFEQYVVSFTVLVSSTVLVNCLSSSWSLVSSRLVFSLPSLPFDLYSFGGWKITQNCIQILILTLFVVGNFSVKYYCSTGRWKWFVYKVACLPKNKLPCKQCLPLSLSPIGKYRQHFTLEYLWVFFSCSLTIVCIHGI